MAPAVVTERSAGGWTSRGRGSSFSNSSERERARSSSREAPTGRLLVLPVGAMSTRYGSETVVLSPFEVITKVPDVVSPT